MVYRSRSFQKYNNIIMYTRVPTSTRRLGDEYSHIYIRALFVLRRRLQPFRFRTLRISQVGTHTADKRTTLDNSSGTIIIVGAC